MDTLRKEKLKHLVNLGKERGYLTYAEIKEVTPEDITDPEQVKSIVSIFNDMGIAVHPEAPSTK